MTQGLSVMGSGNDRGEERTRVKGGRTLVDTGQNELCEAQVYTPPSLHTQTFLPWVVQVSE